MATAAQIRHYRVLNGLSQEELALRANLNPAYLGQVERGLKCPTVDTLYKISKALNIQLFELLRFDTFTERTEASINRLKEMLSHVPDDKIEQVLKVVEDILRLMD